MKIALVAVFALLALWLWRSSRPARGHSPHAERPANAQTQEMIACTYCALHFPVGDVYRGRLGAYCSEEHREKSEG